MYNLIVVFNLSSMEDLQDKPSIKTIMHETLTSKGTLI